jgi:16S rRNA processing protein RimM
VLVGRVGRAYGVRGEVRVEVHTDDPEARFFPGAVLHAARLVPRPERPERPERSDRPERPERPVPTLLTVGAARRYSGGLLIGFEGVLDRSAAEELRGLSLLVEIPPGATPENPDEYYDAQLLGLLAVTTGGTDVGRVEDVLHLPGQDLLAVRHPDGRESLIPFVTEFVPEVDVARGRIVLSPPEGLLELDGPR